MLKSTQLIKCPFTYETPKMKLKTARRPSNTNTTRQNRLRSRRFPVKLDLLLPSLLLLQYFWFVYSLKAKIIAYKQCVLQDLVSLIDPKICAVVEKGCNFGIFDSVIDRSEERMSGNQPTPTKSKNSFFILRKVNEKFTIDNKFPRTNYRYAVFSPFIDFPVEHFRYRFTVHGRFNGASRKAFFKIFELLKNSGIGEFRNEMVEYSEAGAFCRFKLRGAEELLNTEYSGCEHFFQDLVEIRNKISKIKNKLSYGEITNKTTMMLLEMLRKKGILCKDVDFEEYPEIISLIFPFSILNPEFNRNEEGQFIRLGFDLTNVRSGEFSGFFNFEGVPLKYYKTFIF